VKVTPFGELKLRLHRSIKGTVKTLVLKRESSGKWFAIFTVKGRKEPPRINEGAKVGIDLGLSKLAFIPPLKNVGIPARLC
jgi:putative transposase